MARLLGWFSIGLGLVELLAPRRLTRALGMRGSERLLQAFGLREIGTGILSLSVDKQAGIWGRTAGDGLDLATLLSALRSDNPKRDNVALAAAIVAGIALIDGLTAQSLQARHSRGDGMPRNYRNRSGFPKGLEAARGAARDFKQARPAEAMRVH